MLKVILTALVMRTCCLCRSIVRLVVTIQTLFIGHFLSQSSCDIHLCWFVISDTVQRHQSTIKKIGVVGFHLHVHIFSQDGNGLSHAIEVIMIFEDILTSAMYLLTL